MAESPAAPSASSRPSSAGLARARLIWVMKPLGFLLLVLWILHPSTADRLDHAHTALLGFLFGALYGVIVYGPTLQQYIRLHQPSGRLITNRVPDEYYWGKIDNILFDNTGKK